MVSFSTRPALLVCWVCSASTCWVFATTNRCSVRGEGMPSLQQPVPYRLCQLFADPCSAQARGHGIAVFCFCSCAMHFLSALTHVYPDDIYLEKLDHLGIVCLVMGTPISTILVRCDLWHAVSLLCEDCLMSVQGL